MTIRELRPADWPEVRAIYEDGIRSGDATFETETPSWERWDAAHPQLRFVAEHGGALVLLERRSTLVGTCVTT